MYRSCKQRNIARWSPTLRHLPPSYFCSKPKYSMGHHHAFPPPRFSISTSETNFSHSLKSFSEYSKSTKKNRACNRPKRLSPSAHFVIEMAMRTSHFGSIVWIIACVSWWVTPTGYKPNVIWSDTSIDAVYWVIPPTLLDVYIVICFFGVSLHILYRTTVQVQSGFVLENFCISISTVSIILYCNFLLYIVYIIYNSYALV